MKWTCAIYFSFSFILQHVQRVLDSPNFARISDEGHYIGHLFLVGGFAESAIVQEAIRAEFGQAMNVIIPQVSFDAPKVAWFIWNILALNKIPENSKFQLPSHYSTFRRDSFIIYTTSPLTNNIRNFNL